MIYDKRNAAMVIGCLLQQPNLLANAEAYVLTVGDFADRLHRILFSSIFNMFHNGVEDITVNEIHAYLAAYPELYHTFNELKGNEAILMASEIAELGNFRYYYDKLKKMSLLRSLEGSGFDVSPWYIGESYDISKRQELELQLERATIQDIIQSYTGRIAEIETEFVNRESFHFGPASEGIADLVAQLKLQPEIGLKLQGEIFTTVTRGARKAKLYLASGRSGMGKSRYAVGQACQLAYPIKWNLQKEKWEITGHSSRSLLITTELETPEIQTMVLAFLSGINEENILNGMYTPKEEERIRQAMELMEYYSDNLLIYHMPDPNTVQLNSNIRRLVITKKIRNVFYDYVHTSSQLLTEFSGMRIREDVALLLLTTTLKNLANELDVFMWSGTQTNANELEAEFADESCIRGSRAVADKADFGSFLRPATPEHLKIIQPLLKNGMPRPNMFVDIYKNRRSKHKRVKLWMNVDLGTCRFEDLYLTSEYGELLTVDLIRAASPTDIPTIAEMELSNKAKNQPSQKKEITPTVTEQGSQFTV